MIQIFDKEHMHSFLIEYDIIWSKYFSFTGLYKEPSEVPLDLWRLAVIQNDSQPSFSWDLKKAMNAYDTAKHVYSDKGMYERLSEVQRANEKFLGEYVGIPGLDHLFKGEYFYFEWLMHLEYKPQKKEYTHYRDHYIHQIRNMYEMLALFQEYKMFLQGCIDVYRRGSDQVSLYIQQSIKDSREYFYSKMFWADDAEELRLFYQKQQSEHIKPGKTDAATDFYYNYLLHSVAIVSALVHDIGYPICYMMNTTRMLHSFIPLSDNMLHIADAMPHLREILKQSLLYQVVGSENIEKRVNKDLDHGSISAIMLLNQYYENGQIFELHPIKRAVIELSALVIYNHTMKDDNKSPNLFSKNPMSYLFRLCDDIQEWERVYFKITESSNFLVCNSCLMPITRESHGITPVSASNTHEIPNIYTCGCGKGSIRRTRFKYRKLANISVCDRVLFQDYLKDQSLETADHGRMVLEFQYNLLKLLQLSAYNSDFAKKRADDILIIKQMLNNQGDLLPDIYVDAFLSPNPVAIKIECLRRYLDKYTEKNSTEKKYIFLDKIQCKTEQPTDYWQELLAREETDGKILLKTRADRLINSLLEEGRLVRTARIKDEGVIRRHWETNLSFYIVLFELGDYLYRTRREHDPAEIGYWMNTADLLSAAIWEHFDICSEPLKRLIADYFRQQVLRISAEDYFFNKNQSWRYYLETNLSSKGLLRAVDDYVEDGSYDTVKKQIKRGVKGLQQLRGIYDYYSDFELFTAMAQ